MVILKDMAKPLLTRLSRMIAKKAPLLGVGIHFSFVGLAGGLLCIVFGEILYRTMHLIRPGLFDSPDFLNATTWKEITFIFLIVGPVVVIASCSRLLMNQTRSRSHDSQRFSGTQARSFLIPLETNWVQIVDRLIANGCQLQGKEIGTDRVIIRLLRSESFLTDSFRAPATPKEIEVVADRLGGGWRAELVCSNVSWWLISDSNFTTFHTLELLEEKLDWTKFRNIGEVT